MALTILEAAKLDDGNLLKQGIVEQFAMSSGILNILGFEDIPGNALSYNREERLPGVGFRGVNEEYTESTGVLNPQTETLRISGGLFGIDRFITKTMGENQQATQLLMKVKSLALAWERTAIKGDSEADHRQFDGLQKRITGKQLIKAGSTNGGDALSLAKLDELMDQVRNPTHLIMSKSMRRLLTQAQRDPSLSNLITTDKDAWGRQIYLYADLPIVTLTNDNNDLPILDFNEASPDGSTSNNSSIYCVSIADGGWTGIQNGSIETIEDIELGKRRTMIEWFSGMAIYDGHAVARLHGIKNAKVVA